MRAADGEDTHAPAVLATKTTAASSPPTASCANSTVIPVTSRLEDETRSYSVRGQLFFASPEDFTAAFDDKEALSKVIIDLSHAHFWDLTAVGRP
jgi:MFS superfamily sulfate permease-like transporter